MSEELNIMQEIGKLLEGDVLKRLLNIEENCEDDNFPFGLPAGIEIEKILTSVLKVENVVVKARQDKRVKLVFANDIFSEYVSKIKKGHKLTDKQVKGVCYLSVPGLRNEVLSKALEMDEINKSVEGFLILKYLIDKGFEVDSLYTMRMDSRIDNMPDYVNGGGGDAITYILYHRNISSSNNGLKTLSRLIPMIWSDLSDPEFEKSAAHALFALASFSESSDIIDFVYQEKNDVFKKYYSTLKNDVLNQESLLSGESYKPNIEKEEFEELKEVMHKEKLKISVLTMSSSFASSCMTTDDKGRIAKYFMSIRKNIKKMSNNLTLIDNDILDQEVKRVSLAITECLAQLEAVINGKIKSVLFPGEVVNIFNKISDSLKEIVKNHIDGTNYLTIDRALYDLTSNFANLNTEISKHESFLSSKSDDIKALIDDPIENAEQIATISLEIKEIKVQLNGLVNGELIDNFIDFYVGIQGMVDGVLQDAKEREKEINQSALDLQAKDAQTEDIRIEHEANNKRVTELELQVSDLEKTLCLEREHMSAERNSINDIKVSKMKSGMNYQARALMQKVMASPDDCTLPELLDCISCLFPDQVEVLDSAYKSAKESCFIKKANLWKNLLLLSGSYLNDINAGSPDSKARKCFPVKLFSANESQTIDGNPVLKSKRTGVYNGKNVYFDKHLRFGVAHNERETLRLHFDVIDGKLVIFHCGKHLDNK